MTRDLNCVPERRMNKVVADGKVMAVAINSDPCAIGIDDRVGLDEHIATIFNLNCSFAGKINSIAGQSSVLGLCELELRTSVLKQRILADLDVG